MTAQRLHFPRSRRLSGNGVFKAILDARVRAECAAFALHAAPSTAPETRVGISIGRRVGIASRRNRLKRMLREAFRLTQASHPKDAPAPYDIVLVVRPHEELPLAEYERHLLAAIEHVHGVWRKRAARRGDQPDQRSEDSP
jgi:ribonuclease P protein component